MTHQLENIWLSTWIFKTKHAAVAISGVVVKGDDVEAIKQNAVYLNRAKRGLYANAVLKSVTLDRQIGQGIKE